MSCTDLKVYNVHDRVKTALAQRTTATSIRTVQCRTTEPKEIRETSPRPSSYYMETCCCRVAGGPSERGIWFYHKRGEQSGTSENPGRPRLETPQRQRPLDFPRSGPAPRPVPLPRVVHRRVPQKWARASTTVLVPRINRATAPVRACRQHCTPGLPRACALPACVSFWPLALPRPAGPPRARGRRKHKRYLAGKLASWLLASPVASRQSPAPFDRPRPLRAAVAPHARLDCLAAECRAARERAQPKGRGPAGVVDGPIIGAGRATQASIRRQALRRRGTGYVCSYRATHVPPTVARPRAQPCRELPPACLLMLHA